MTDKSSVIPPRKEFIRNMLQYGLMTDENPAENSWYVQTASYLNSDAANLGRNRNWIVKLFIKLAYQNKERIKSIPMLNSLAVSTRARLVKGQNNTRNRTTLDFSPILELDVDVFIQDLYIQALGRVADPAGLKSAKEALLKGMPREGLIYLVCTSQEFANRAPVRNLNQYHRLYSRYIMRERIKRLPIIGLPFQMETIERQLTELKSAMEKVNQNIEDAIAKIEVANQNTESKNIQMDMAHQEVKDALAKIDMVNQTIKKAITAMEIANHVPLQRPDSSDGMADQLK